METKTVTIKGLDAEGSGFVYIDNKLLKAERSLKVRNHSPDGFAWGYGGSGPAQLALAILLEVTDDECIALFGYQNFKWNFISCLKQEEFEVKIKFTYGPELEEKIYWENAEGSKDI